MVNTQRDIRPPAKHKDCTALRCIAHPSPAAHLALSCQLVEGVQCAAQPAFRPHFQAFVQNLGYLNAGTPGL